MTMPGYQSANDTPTGAEERRADKLVARVRDALAVPAERAALRRALGRPVHDPVVRHADRIVVRFLPEDPDEATERAFYAVPALMAAQPRTAREADTTTVGAEDTSEGADTPDSATPPADADGAPAASATSEVSRPNRRSLGAALARWVLAEPIPQRRTSREHTVEKRLHLLCRQDLDGLHRHLPRLVLHIRGDDVRLDWTRLVLDLSDWNRHRDQITKRWLRDFHGTLAHSPAHTNNPESED